MKNTNVFKMIFSFAAGTGVGLLIGSFIQKKKDSKKLMEEVDRQTEAVRNYYTKKEEEPKHPIKVTVKDSSDSVKPNKASINYSKYAKLTVKDVAKEDNKNNICIIEESTLDQELAETNYDIKSLYLWSNDVLTATVISEDTTIIGKENIESIIGINYDEHLDADGDYIYVKNNAKKMIYEVLYRNESYSFGSERRDDVE